jgi:aminopeptidase YwaD
MKALLIVALLILPLYYKAQNQEYAKEIIKTLCSDKFSGRGYTHSGDSLASDFIVAELKKHNIQYFEAGFFQDFTISVNTFPEEPILFFDEKELTPITDYLIKPQSAGASGVFDVIVLDNDFFSNVESVSSLMKKKLDRTFLLIDTSGIHEASKKLAEFILKKNPYKAAGIIESVNKKLSWHMSQHVSDFTELIINKENILLYPKKIKINISNDYKPNHRTRNVIGFLEGKSDSFIVFSAHYDHLGAIGKKHVFPGANDNASGVSMCLDLARHLSLQKNRKNNYVFLFFSAEEVGILGSEYFCSNPYFDLSKIKLLINLDLVGTGDDGITLVNGAVLKKEFELFYNANEKKNYLKQVKARGEAANSDHYPFYKRGVPSFFIYTMGGISHYHNNLDIAATLPLTEYSDLFRLIVDVVNQL